MPLPTDAELRAALLALGRLARAGGYYADLANGTSQLSDQEKTDLIAALQTLGRGNITPLEVLNRQTALPSTPFFTATRQGVYIVLGYFLLSQAASAGNATVTLGWNDGVGARTEAQLSAVPINAVGQRSFLKAVVLGAGQAISATVALAGVTGTPTYSIYARIIEL